jgi:hypothetical protein
MTSRDARTGRWTRVVPDVDAESRFDPVADSIEDIDNISGAPSASTIDRPRYAPQADDLAQFDARSPLRARNLTLVHPDDEGHHNAVMRTAARSAGPMDSTAFLTGLAGFPASPTGIQGSRVEVHGDHNPLSPVRSQDIAPGRPPGRVRTVTDDPADNAEEIQRRMDEGLFSFDASNALRPVSRGQGRARNR